MAMSNEKIAHNRILMCNYNCMCDHNETIVGHTLKVTREYAEMLTQDFELALIGTKCLVESLGDGADIIFDQVDSLPYQIYVDAPFTIKRRIADKFGMFRNLKKCFEVVAPNSTLFFYQVDFFFFLYLFTHRIKDNSNKICCLIYHQDFTGGVLAPLLRYIYKRALRKIDSVIYTQKGHSVDHPNVCWMPDYIYDEKYYSKSIADIPSDSDETDAGNSEQKPLAVALGTMNRYKQLEELVEFFPADKISLRIIGRFDDVERFDGLREKVFSENCESVNGKHDRTKDIQIKNCVLSDEEYYSYLSQAKYSVLPYDMNQYVNRTSGVLQESIFMDCIPIAPKELLEQNELPGVGYDEIVYISDAIKNCESETVYNEMKHIKQIYAKERVYKEVSHFLKECL